MDKEKYKFPWVVSIEIWKEADQVTHFMRDEIKKGLRDANGDPLPDAVNEFFLDLIFQRVKPRKGGKLIPSVQAIIREQYTGLLFFEQANDSMTDPSKRLLGDKSPSERVKEGLAEKSHTTVATIDQIVNLRPSRQRRPPRKP